MQGAASDCGRGRLPAAVGDGIFNARPTGRRRPVDRSANIPSTLLITTNNKKEAPSALPSSTLRSSPRDEYPTCDASNRRIVQMLKTVKSKAEELFTATQKKDKLALKEKEKAEQERADRVSNLRALRLAKEAADKEAAQEASAAKTKKPARSPQGSASQS
jgi:hypothetical protein